MSTNIDRDQLFWPPLLKVRNVLKAWRYGRTTDAHDIALRKDVDLNPCTVMVLLEELQARKVEIEIQDVAGLPSTGVLACSLSDEMPELLPAVVEPQPASVRLSFLRGLDSRCDDWPVRRP